MTDSFKSVLDEANANIQRNTYLRQEWENSTKEQQNTMLQEMIFNVGFDRGYEHRKKVEASNERTNRTTC